MERCFYVVMKVEDERLGIWHVGKGGEHKRRGKGKVVSHGILQIQENAKRSEEKRKGKIRREAERIKCGIRE